MYSFAACSFGQVSKIFLIVILQSLLYTDVVDIYAIVESEFIFIINKNSLSLFQRL